VIKAMQAYDAAIARTLFSSAEIAAAVERLASGIVADHRRVPLTLVGVLKGALYVAADLARAISAIPDGPSEIGVDYMCVSSYGNASRSSGEVRLLKDLTDPVTDRHVVIVEDIVDNGLTLEYLRATGGAKAGESARLRPLRQAVSPAGRGAGRIRGTAGARRIRRRLRPRLPGIVPEPAVPGAAPARGLYRRLSLCESGAV
jgi:hypoxanthine phosphoribosyltransferase